MSMTHVSQFKSHLARLIKMLIELTRCGGSGPAVTSRLPPAIHDLCGVAPDIAARPVTNGGNDDGIDVVTLDETIRRL